MIPSPALHLRGTAEVGGMPVFENIALNAEGGEWTCILGSSGVGKSTILKLFAGIDDEIRLNGTVEAADGPLAGRVALMAQDDMLLPWLSVRENALLGARLRGSKPDRDRLENVLVRVGLADMADRRPRELSGGQRQRVALARVLMENRLIVLLDEPFSALDARTRAQMQELTAALLLGRTVILVTHDPAEAARLGHRIMIMYRNGIVEFPVPSGPVPRACDARDVLTAQAELLTRLREDDAWQGRNILEPTQ